MVRGVLRAERKSRCVDQTGLILRRANWQFEDYKYQKLLTSSQVVSTTRRHRSTLPSDTQRWKSSSSWFNLRRNTLRRSSNGRCDMEYPILATGRQKNHIRLSFSLSWMRCSQNQWSRETGLLTMLIRWNWKERNCVLFADGTTKCKPKKIWEQGPSETVGCTYVIYRKSTATSQRCAIHAEISSTFHQWVTSTKISDRCYLIFWLRGLDGSAPLLDVSRVT